MRFRSFLTQMSFGAKLQFSIVFLIALPMALISFIQGETNFRALVQEKEQELMFHARFLALEMPASFEEILAQKGKSEETPDKKILALNSVLQPIVNKIALTHPDMGTGYYDLQLGSRVAIGPSFSRDLLKELPPGHPYLKSVKTGRPEVVENPHSLMWQGKPALAVTYPIIREGILIGNTWANMKTEDIAASAARTRNKLLLATFGVFVLGTFGARFVTRKSSEALQTFAYNVKSNFAEPLGQTAFPELTTLSEEVALAREEQLKSFRLAEKILDNIIDGYFILDCEWHIVNGNEAAERFIFRKPLEEVQGQNLWELYPLVVGTIVDHEYHRAVAENTPLTFAYEGVYNPGIWFEMNLFPQEDGLHVYFRDITKRKESEKALQLSEERFHKAFHNSPDMMSIISLESMQFIEVNQAFSNMTGYSREEALGSSPDELGFLQDPQARQFIDRCRQKRKPIQNLELKYRTKSGERRLGLFSMDFISLSGEECSLNTFKDITGIRKLENEMSRLDRLNLVGEMAAGIGHEVRNPMTTVRGYLQLLAEREKFFDEKETFNLLIEELDRANSIITEFLSLARNRKVDQKEIDLNGIVNSLLPLIKADAIVSDKHVKAELLDIPPLLLDEREIRQLLLNLVKNGLEAMKNGGVLTIKTYQEGNCVVLAVRDQGTGIPENVREQIGNPFYTTKDTGTGLGLPVCYSIASKHNATIEFVTDKEGTTFYVRFTNN